MSWEVDAACGSLEVASRTQFWVGVYVLPFIERRIECMFEFFVCGFFAPFLGSLV